MADPEHGEQSTVERSRMNVFEQYAPEAANSLQTTLKTLTDTVAEMRSEINSLKRHAPGNDVSAGVTKGAATESTSSAGETPCKQMCIDEGSESDGVEEFLSEGPAEGGDFDFMDFYESDCATGENVSDQLAKLCQSALTGKVKEEKLKQIKQKHLRPANAEYVQTPQVNDVIWRKMSVTARAKDFMLQKAHSNYGTALVPILRAMEALQKGDSSTVRENIGDAFKLLTTAMATTTQMRQEKIKRDMLPIFRPICSCAPSPTQLFGDKIEDEIKKCKESKDTIMRPAPFLGKRPGLNHNPRFQKRPFQQHHNRKERNNAPYKQRPKYPNNKNKN